MVFDLDIGYFSCLSFFCCLFLLSTCANFALDSVTQVFDSFGQLLANISNIPMLLCGALCRGLYGIRACCLLCCNCVYFFNGLHNILTIHQVSLLSPSSCHCSTGKCISVVVHIIHLHVYCSFHCHCKWRRCTYV